MRIKRVLFALLLSGGVVLGFGSAIGSVMNHSASSWHTGHCERGSPEAPPVP